MYQIRDSESGNREVYRGNELLGHLSSWDCDTEFIPIRTNPNPGKLIFTILNLENTKDNNGKILDCISEIMQLDLNNLSGIYNYQHPDDRQRTFDEIKSHFDKITKERAKARAAKVQ